jgi:hypothetical protein
MATGLDVLFKFPKFLGMGSTLGILRTAQSHWVTVTCGEACAAVQYRYWLPFWVY